MKRTLRAGFLSVLALGLVLAVVALPGGLSVASADAAQSRELEAGIHRAGPINGVYFFYHGEGHISIMFDRGASFNPQFVHVMFLEKNGVLAKCAAGAVCLDNRGKGQFGWGGIATKSADGSQLTIKVYDPSGANVATVTIGATWQGG